MSPTENERLATLESQMGDAKGDIHTIFLKVDGLLLKLSARPSWAVLAIITFLSSLCCALLVALATRVAP